MKIVKMAARLRETRYIQEFPEKVPFTYEYDHDFLIEVVDKISKRFRKITTRTDFWKGNVFIYRSSVEINDLIREYLCSGTTGLWLHKQPQIADSESQSIAALAKKCPNLSKFSMSARVTEWPKFAQPWNSMEQLYNLYWASKEVKLHHSLPRLKDLCLKGGTDSNPTMLPDMACCDKMQRLNLSEGYFCIPAVSAFPKELKYLVLAGANFKAIPGYHSSHEEILEDIKHYLTDCEIEVFSKFDLLFI